MKLILILAGINKQNCRIWGTEKPPANIENPLNNWDLMLLILRSFNKVLKKIKKKIFFKFLKNLKKNLKKI